MIAPVIVTFLTQWIKKLPLFTNLSDSAQTPAIRTLAAVIAIVYVIFGAWVSGNIDSNVLLLAVQTLGYSGVAWLGSLGVFHAFVKSAPATTSPQATTAT